MEAHDEEDNVYMQAMELTAGHMMNMTLKAAIELGILQIIAGAGDGAKLTAGEIVAQLATANPQAPDIVGRMLRLLAAQNIVTCAVEAGDDGQAECKYGLTPVCKYFTEEEDGASLAPYLLLLTDMVHLQCWSHLKDAMINNGNAFNIAFNMSFFDKTKVDPQFGNIFNVSMRSISLYNIKKMIKIYDGFNDVKVLVDVGDGIGTAISIITSKFPHIKGINFDLPHVISHAQTSYPGLEHISGDMFDSVPNGDAIFMKHILHNWDDGDCLKILKNCWNSLPYKGKVIIMECALPKTLEVSPAAKYFTCLDLLMVADFSAKQRTIKEFEELCKNAGFSAFKATYFLTYYSIIEFTK